MYIGLYDLEIVQDIKSFFIPSLEMMKLSSFYRRNGFIDWIDDCERIEKYDKVYYKKDIAQLKTHYQDQLSNEKIIPVGKGLLKRYLVMPDEIEASRPDKSFYQDHFNKHKSTFSSRMSTIWNKILNDPNVLCLRTTNGERKLPDFNYLNRSDTELFLFDEDILKTPYFKEIVNSSIQNHNLIRLMEITSTKDLDIFRLARENSIKPKDRNDYGLIYGGPLNKQTFLDNYSLFNRNYVIEIPPYSECGPSIENYYITQLEKYSNYVFYIISKGGLTRIVKSNSILAEQKTLEEKILDDFIYYIKGIGKTTEIDFLTFQKKSSKIKGERVEAVLKKYPSFYPTFSTRPIDLVNRGIWLL